LISVFLFFGSSFAWQGRMAGMGDPYGLVQDESDMLIHPAMIMNSSGTRLYTHYRFTYTDVMDWDYKWDLAPGLTENFKASGDEYKNEALIGTDFNVGSWRMGIFFTYDNQSGDYDGKVDSPLYSPDELDFDLESDKSDFAFSLMFGVPIDCVAIGFEAGLGYHDEENKISQQVSAFGNATNPIAMMMLMPAVWANTHPYMLPYDSEYMETFLKASVASKLGCNADFGLTLNGGYIFFGDNELYTDSSPIIPGDLELDGDVDGWSIGGDFWFRYKIVKHYRFFSLL
jgi:hypothetical protein